MMSENEAGTLVALKAVRAELIEKKIAEHHGRISVESTPDRGTTFRVFLPMKGMPEES